MSRRCSSTKPTPTPLNGEAAKPTRNAIKKGKIGSLSVRDREIVNENQNVISPAKRGGARMCRLTHEKPK